MMTHRLLPLLVLALAGCPEDSVTADDAAPADMRLADMRPDARPLDAAPEPEPRPDMAAEPEAVPDMGGEPEPPILDMGGEPEPPDPDMGADMGGEPEPPGPDMGEVDMGLPGPDMGAQPNPLSPRPAAQACRLPDAPPLGDYVSEQAFPNLRFSRPLWLGAAPGDPDTLFVLEQGGTIYAFDDRQDVAQNERSTFLNIDASRAGNEEGLLGLAFHPNYAENGRFFVYYSGAGAQCGGTARCSIISEFSRADARSADPASERVVLRFAQPFSNHNGGDIDFGPDGYLYVAVGDGGSGGDPLNSGQTTSTLLGNVLRLDIDDPPPAEMEGGGDGDDLCGAGCQYDDDGDCDDGGPNSDFSVCAYGSDCIDCGPRPPQAGTEIRAYRIPPTNPFADGEGGRAEIYAWGLRNVWRMAFDTATGVLWAGDVGQNAFEEIDKIEAPGNFGWNVREGFECLRGNDCPCADCVDPVHVYPHAQGRSVTGGFVYRGQRLPALWGRYVFADFVSGRVWALEERDGQAAAVVQLTSVNQPSSFGQDAQGRLYILSFGNQSILRLRRQAAPPGEPFPQLLSETGCFDNVAEHDLADSILPYDLVQPFWSDGATKLRAMALPADAVIGFALNGPFTFPVGTAFLKTFLLPNEAGQTRRVETRIYARQAQGWRGFTWRWNAAQDDALLVEGALDEELMGPNGPQTWHYPSTAECDQCHTQAAGRSLGWRTAQLNRSVDYPRGTANQLSALERAGYLALPRPAEALPAWPAIADNAAPIAVRARAYLDINCAMCHQPDGPGNAQIDLRFETAFGDTGLCDVEPAQGDADINNAR
ncbi:MAG: putative repeat protein (TIGR03806 family), partial [Bradymonadia bacterium]